MTDLSPREKALVEALQRYKNAWGSASFNDDWSKMDEARLSVFETLSAYDLPKPKIPVLPPWEEFAVGRVGRTAGEPVGPAVRVCIAKDIWVTRDQYETLRTLTSKEQE